MGYILQSIAFGASGLVRLRGPMVGMGEIGLMLLHRIPSHVFGILMGFPLLWCIAAHLGQIGLPFLVQRSILLPVLGRSDLFLGQIVVQ